MTRLHRTITVNLPLEEAFERIADFSTVQHWDPGVARASQMSGNGPEVGAEYEVIARFGGREIPMVYRTTELERPVRVVLVGDGSSIHAVDTISFRARDDSDTQIDYVAEFTLRLPFRLVQPLMRGSFEKLADRAIEGMAAYLA